MDDKKIAVRLTGIPETLLIPLWARSVECGLPKGKQIIYDPKSREILNQLDYDTSKFAGSKGKFSQVGCVVRAKIFDEETIRFLEEYPDAIVLNIGCGLDTRGERLRPYGATAWYDLDVPEVIEMRRNFFTEDDYLHFIPKPFNGEEWLDDIKHTGQPILVIAEGIFCYFSEREIRLFINTVIEHFPRGRFLIESVPKILTGVKSSGQKHPAVAQTEDKPDFKWGTSLHAKELNDWHPRLAVSRVFNFTDYGRKRWGLFRYCGLRYLNNKIIALDF